MNQKKTKQIPKYQKADYKNLLERDNSKDFSEEFVRTTNLERKLIDEFGFEGIKLIFEKQNSKNYFEFGNLPDNSPWAEFNNSNLQDFISENFKAIKAKIPKFLEVMKSRCRYIYTESIEDSWKLHYLLDMTLYDDREYYRIFTGGLPNQNPQPNNNLKFYNWSLPKDLAEFYSIHNGFGELNGNFYVQNNEEIAVMNDAKQYRPTQTRLQLRNNQ